MDVEEAETEIREGVEVRRLFKEMERQGLIRLRDETVDITDLGRWYASNVAGSLG